VKLVTTALVMFWTSGDRLRTSSSRWAAVSAADMLMTPDGVADAGARRLMADIPFASTS
jgi:hypothetical protein